MESETIQTQIYQPPIWKICSSKWIHLPPRDRGESSKKSLKPAPRNGRWRLAWAFLERILRDLQDETLKHINFTRWFFVTKLHPRSLEVTIPTIWKGHVNSPSRKGHQLAELPGKYHWLSKDLNPPNILKFQPPKNPPKNHHRIRGWNLAAKRRRLLVVFQHCNYPPWN